MNATPSTTEALRARIVRALGHHADPRAEEVLRTAALAMARGARSWEGSSSHVQGVIIGLGLPADMLGEVVHLPHVVDALVAAVASAVASDEAEASTQESLEELRLYWCPAAAPAYGVYRDAPRPEVTLQEAMKEYLSAAGDGAAAELASRSEVEATVGERRAHVVLRGVPRSARPAMEACVCALLLGFEGRAVRVSWSKRRTRRKAGE